MAENIHSHWGITASYESDPPRISATFLKPLTTVNGPPSPSKQQPIPKDSQGPSTGTKRKSDDVTSEKGHVDNRPVKVHATYVKDEDHWVIDGTVLLQFGNTRFKVHRSSLARESPWFRSLFDQRAGKAPVVPHDKCQPGIESILRNAEKVDDLDLFFLGFDNGPDAVKFGRFLTAMQRGIDYSFNPPSFEVVADIYIVSSFFLVDRYRRFAENSLKTMFPDTWSAIKPSPSPFSLRALSMGLVYMGDLSTIVRHNFYDLARTPPIPVMEGNQGGSNLNTPVTLSAIDMENVKADTFLRLMNTQHNLVLAWDKVSTILKHDCSAVKPCAVPYRGPIIYQRVKQAFLFDPIQGIGQILADIDCSTDYCQTVKTKVNKQLVSELVNIWTQIKVWGGLP